MALGCPFAVMAILLAETLITLGASFQCGCQGQEAGVPFSDASRQPMSSGATLLGAEGEEGLGEVLGGLGGYGSGSGDGWMC